MGVASVFATHAVFMWAMADSHYSGWPMSIVVGVIVVLAVARMTRERFLPLEENPVSRRIAGVYTPALRWVLNNKKTFMIGPVIILAAGLWIWRGTGREFMPPLDEASFLYTPSLLPQAGLGPAIEVNAKQDMAIATVPEVENVVGKLGRAKSALDPAPIGMMESIIILKPEAD